MGNPIPLHTSLMLSFAHVLDTRSEVHDLLHASPDGFDARVAVAFAREETAEHGDEPYHFVQPRRFVGRGLFVEDEGGLPFIGLEQQPGIEVRASSRTRRSPTSISSSQHGGVEAGTAAIVSAHF